MSTYLIYQLLDLWDKGKLTIEQAIGHALQHLQSHLRRVQDLERRVRELEQRVDDGK